MREGQRALWLPQLCHATHTCRPYRTRFSRSILPTEDTYCIQCPWNSCIPRRRLDLCRRIFRPSLCRTGQVRAGRTRPFGPRFFHGVRLGRNRSPPNNATDAALDTRDVKPGHVPPNAEEEFGGLARHLWLTGVAVLQQHFGRLAKNLCGSSLQRSHRRPSRVPLCEDEVLGQIRRESPYHA